MPVTWTLSTPEETYNLIQNSFINYSIVERRKYNEPKLSKPKELKGIKQICSVDYIPKKNKSNIFIKNNDVYIKHTDYFSYIWKPPAEDFDKSLSYLMKKIFSQRQKRKIYIS